MSRRRAGTPPGIRPIEWGPSTTANLLEITLRPSSRHTRSRRAPSRGLSRARDAVIDRYRHRAHRGIAMELGDVSDTCPPEWSRHLGSC